MFRYISENSFIGGVGFEQFLLFKMAAMDTKKLRKRLSYDGLDYIKGKHSVNMSCNNVCLSNCIHMK